MSGVENIYIYQAHSDSEKKKISALKFATNFQILRFSSVLARFRWSHSILRPKKHIPTNFWVMGPIIGRGRGKSVPNSDLPGQATSPKTDRPTDPDHDILGFVVILALIHRIKKNGNMIEHP